ncbi:MAG: hypothetical protein HXK70_00950 [Clostridiales bacterium]|nr:hypothetical protein [Clostridiales bacterium]
MKKILKYITLMIIIVFFSNITLAKQYRNKNLLVRETKVLTLKKNTKGKIMYFLPKGRYKVILSPNDIDYIDSYIIGSSVELNPEINGNSFQYDIDTNKSIESFYQEYKVNKSTKIRIEIEKIE